MMHCTEQ